MKTNKEYKEAALARIRGNWSPVVLASVIIILFTAIVTGSLSSFYLFGYPTTVVGWVNIFGMLVSFFIMYPMSIGYANACLSLYTMGDLNVTSNLWRFSTTNYLHKVAGYFLMYIKVVLWTLLFVIPGLIMSFAYAMTPYILEEHPELSAWQASTESRKMMKGHKFDLFYLYLSFIGWFILCILTAGIGFIWLAPYAQTAVAAFYEDIKVSGVTDPAA